MADGRKIAIVTGAASGIGRAMTLGLLGAGVDVAAVDRNEAGPRRIGGDRARQGGNDADHARRPRAAGRVRCDRLRRAEPVRPDRRAGEQRGHRPILDQAGPAAQSAALLGDHAGALAALPGGERHRADHDGARGGAAHAGRGLGAGDHRHHQPRDDGARGLPAVRRQQGGGRGGDGGAGGGPEGHRRHLERAGAGRRDQHRRSSATRRAIARGCCNRRSWCRRCCG